jgi:DNA-binding transcriptional MerR regulator
MMGAATDKLPAAGVLGPRPVKSSTAFRTISEVAEELDVAQHVLRFWESKFAQVRPLKRGGGRRYYRPEDVELLRQIRSLLYDEGYTIKGAQKLLRGRRTRGGEADSDAPPRELVIERAQLHETPSGTAPTSTPARETPARQPGLDAPAAGRVQLSELRRRLKPMIEELTELRERLRHAAS